jgi:hypothetical protein
MGKIKVNEIEKHDATEITINSDIVGASGTSISTPSVTSDTLSTDTIAEKTSAAGVTIDGVTLKDSKIGGTITIPSSTGTMALTSDISAGGLSVADQWRLTANITSNTDPISSNLERPDGTLQSYMGTGMTVSSGIWTFPSTGYWLVTVVMSAYVTNAGGRTNIDIFSTNDNSTYDNIGIVRHFQDLSGQTDTDMVTQSVLIDVTDTSNDKIKFVAGITGGGTIVGSTDDNLTAFTFLKLGDT